MKILELDKIKSRLLDINVTLSDSNIPNQSNKDFVGSITNNQRNGFEPLNN
jgi:hypothetical protein